ncbi:hypothetical protein A2U01_0075037 [Trifolium medium]|uniref:Uncharacterized protein n=1 Tax=Trifolium medium TaxID=97028 RepID=A0A392T0V9_9FABA|nr:hypothetical protein [Trifolium medium]
MSSWPTCIILSSARKGGSGGGNKLAGGEGGGSGTPVEAKSNSNVSDSVNCLSVAPVFLNAFK